MTVTNKNIHIALHAAQKEIGAAVKGAVNPFFKSNYADLGSVIEAIKEPLNNNGLTLTQELNVINHGSDINPVVVNTLCTMLRHISGEVIESSVILPEVKDIQKWGAALTYYKRYTLQAFMLVPTEDDDGNSVSQPINSQPKAVAGRFGGKK